MHSVVAESEIDNHFDCLECSVCCHTSFTSFRVLVSVGKLLLFDCIPQGCSARAFADIVGVFSYTILCKPVQMHLANFKHATHKVKLVLT